MFSLFGSLSGLGDEHACDGVECAETCHRDPTSSEDETEPAVASGVRIRTAALTWPQTLGTVRLMRPLGEGGMGVVWLGWDEARERHVAVKVMHPALDGNPHAVARFEREVRILASVQDPAVPAVFEAGTSEAVRYVVLEHIEGVCLAERLRTGTLHLEDARTTIDQLLRVLGAVHARGVVHRDVKPANIMIRPSGDLSLVDFGIANARTESPMTEDGALLGTPAYMSPEQTFQAETHDARIDLWAAAVVAYECLSGRPPFEGPTFGAICVALHQGHYEPVSSLRCDVPRALDGWFARAFAREPENRFATATEMADAWRRATAPVTLAAA